MNKAKSCFERLCQNFGYNGHQCKYSHNTILFK